MSGIDWGEKSYPLAGDLGYEGRRFEGTWRRPVRGELLIRDNTTKSTWRPRWTVALCAGVFFSVSFYGALQEAVGQEAAQSGRTVGQDDVRRAVGQDDVQSGRAVGQEAAQSGRAVGQEAAQSASSSEARPLLRTRRVIQNREFSDREKIELLLNAHCDFPSKEDLLSTSPDADTHLQAIFADESVILSVRMRAVQALSYFATPQNRETLESVLAHPEQVEHPLMLIQAIRSYVKVAPDLAPKAIEPFLSYDGDLIRFVAIDSLKNCPGQAAIDVLKARSRVETNRFFQTRLRQAIDGHCQKSCR